MSLFVSIGPTLFAALLSAVIWNYFFIPPVRTFYIGEPADIAMCLALLVAASVTGTLTSRIRRGERLLRAREQRTAVLYQIASDLSAARDRPGMASAIGRNLSALLKADVGYAFKTADGQLTNQTAGVTSMWMTEEKEWTVAAWAFEHSKPAGWSTDTLASVGGLYIPLIGPTETVGVLGLKRDENRSLTPDELNLTMAVARQLAVAAERDLLQERARQMEQLQESERLYQTILSTVSHELRTPLTAIIGNASALANEQIATDAAHRNQLSVELISNAERLNRVVSNLLDMSRLSSGKLVLARDWHDLNGLISVTLDAHKAALAKHQISVRLAENLPLVKIDFQLFQQALANLLMNAAVYTQPGTVIEVAAFAAGRELLISVTDHGPGLPPETMPHIFEMFYRAPGARPGGAGIGLAIAKGIVELHGGSIAAENVSTGGARFTITLPIDPQPQMPKARSET